MNRGANHRVGHAVRRRPWPPKLMSTCLWFFLRLIISVLLAKSSITMSRAGSWARSRGRHRWPSRIGPRAGAPRLDGLGPNGGSGGDAGEDVAAGFTGRSPGFLLAVARLLRLRAGVSSRVRLVALADPALAPLLVDVAWSPTAVEESRTEVGLLPVERYETTDLVSGQRAAVHLAGDVVPAAAGVELDALDTPATLPSGELEMRRVGWTSEGRPGPRRRRRPLRARDVPPSAEPRDQRHVRACRCPLRRMVMHCCAPGAC
jgi:hypothetical protein